MKSLLLVVREWGLGNRYGAKVVNVAGVAKTPFPVSVRPAAMISSFSQATALAFRFS